MESSLSEKPFRTPKKSASFGPVSAQNDADQSSPRHISYRYRVVVGRPNKPIISRQPNGRWLVRATVAGQRIKKRCGTEEEAIAVLDSWCGAKPLPLLPTRLNPAQLREAEAAIALCDSAGVRLIDVVRQLNSYKAPSSVTFEAAIAEYLDKKGKGASAARQTNVVASVRSFSAFLGRIELGNPSRDEVERWLSFREKTVSGGFAPATFNHLLNDLASFLSWHTKRGTLHSNPCVTVDRRKVKRGTPTTLQPEAAAALMRDVEANYPSWVPFVALCLFAGLRPNPRDGESRRLDDALRSGKTVIFPGGIEVHGKTGDIRVVPWSACGPLKEFLTAYPLTKETGLLPLPARAERDWKKLRARHGLAPDVLRHTAASCMTYSGTMTLGEVAMALGNSEAMLRKHYIGRWSRDLTAAVWALRPLHSVTRQSPAAVTVTA